MRHHPTGRPHEAVATDLARRDGPDDVVAAGRPALAVGPEPRRWVRTLGLCFYVAASLLLTGAVLLPVVALAIFVLWLKIVISAALGSSTESVGLGGAASPFGQVLDLPAHDPLTGTALMVAILGSAVASGLGITAVVLLCAEVLLILGALILFVIGRRLRRGRR